MTSQKFFSSTVPARPHLVRPGGGLSGELHDLRSDLETAFGLVETELVTYHEPIVSASAGSSAPGQGPTPVVIGPTLALSFTLNTDSAHRNFKIPGTFASDPAFHIHWTKTTNVDESGKNVRWRVEYAVWPGQDGDLITSATAEVEDTYSDDGTTTRLSMRTADTPLIGFQKFYYASVKVSAVTPVGTPLAAEPALVDLDLTYKRYINISNV